ncbi:hypothetical protein [Methylovulum miyakonense]|uniref:hypothetical protein n=1 Tax=Methylovulum miyakonense TaxID=645578 RepID=UPI000376EC2D|nr:hypothetical protein [Methylovulum miyakonense]
MNKASLGAIFLGMALTGTSALAANRAIEINIGGRGPAVDGPAFETVKDVIGHAVASGIVDKFTVRGYGVEGGFSACAQASPWVKNVDFYAFIRQLRTITPNAQTTFYSLAPVEACSDDVVVPLQE